MPLRVRPRALCGLAAAGLGAALLLTSCTGSAPSGIAVGTVGRGTVTEVVQAPANVVARATAAISSPASGTVKAVLVKDGALVKAGQVLLTIDSPQALTALTQARAADKRAASSGSAGTTRVSTAGLDRADVAAAQAFSTARQAADLIPDATLKAQALAQLATAQAQYAAARSAAASALAQANAGLGGLERAAQSLADAQRAQTQATLTAAQATVAGLTVRAPIAGTVVLGGVSPGSGSASSTAALVSQLPSAVQGQAESLLGASGSAGSASVVGVLEPGTPVTPGAGLLTVTDTSTLTLAAAVDETDILTVRPGIAGSVDFDAVPDATYPAVVTSVDLAPTTSSRGGVSYIVRMSLGAGTDSDGTPAPQPRPGMSAVASLDVLTATDVVAVPAAAVFRDGSRNSVWIVAGSGRASKRYVTLGAEGDTSVQVLSGVVPGDRIVVKGADKVVEGQQVGGR